MLAGHIINHRQEHPFMNKHDLDAGAKEVEKILPVGAHVTIFGELAQSFQREARHGHRYYIRPDKWVSLTCAFHYLYLKGDQASFCH